jgi:hypothetical protein
VREGKKRTVGYVWPVVRSVRYTDACENCVRPVQCGTVVRSDRASESESERTVIKTVTRVTSDAHSPLTDYIDYKCSYID